MRTELVFAARRTLSNRYLLCKTAAKATRKFHRPRARIEETTNAVLQRIAHSHPHVLLSRLDLEARAL